MIGHRDIEITSLDSNSRCEEIWQKTLFRRRSMRVPKVLIVDDEHDIVETIKFNLELEDVECLEAFDGEEALSKAKTEMPDLIILDIMLPKINGYKVARLLKFDEKYKGIPIIMLTEHAHEFDLKIGEDTGVDECVTKPFDMDKLIALVKQYLMMNF
jgi:two-component system alkaline phosphatase synthesis response regulator PhoP